MNEQQIFSERWNALCEEFGIDKHREAESCLQDLIHCYSEDHRRYHNIQHVVNCLNEFKDVKKHLIFPGEAEVALFYHDIVYVPGAADCEERSAVEAYHSTRKLGLSTDFCMRTYRYVLSTDHRGDFKGRDELHIRDIDKSILGKPWAEYKRYSENVVDEYIRATGAIKVGVLLKRLRFVERFLEKAGPGRRFWLHTPCR